MYNLLNIIKITEETLMNILETFCFGSAAPTGPIIVVTSKNGVKLASDLIYAPPNVKLIQESDEYGAIEIRTRSL